MTNEGTKPSEQALLAEREARLEAFHFKLENWQNPEKVRSLYWQFLGFTYELEKVGLDSLEPQPAWLPAWKRGVIEQQVTKGLQREDGITAIFLTSSYLALPNMFPLFLQILDKTGLVSDSGLKALSSAALCSVRAWGPSDPGFGLPVPSWENFLIQCPKGGFPDRNSVLTNYRSSNYLRFLTGEADRLFPSSKERETYEADPSRARQLMKEMIQKMARGKAPISSDSFLFQEEAHYKQLENLALNYQDHYLMGNLKINIRDGIFFDITKKALNLG
ncbi:MAG: hypothetical protein M1514_02910 [Patescibacteria group bacterium]|nr:hypothetical protein [Patescibacteria group bacterium]